MLSESSSEPSPKIDAQAQPWSSASAFLARTNGALVVLRDGEVLDVSESDAAARLAEAPLLLCHAPFNARRLRTRPPARRANLFDVLELYAFTCPTRFAVPTPKGLAEALGLPTPSTAEEAALALYRIADGLLARLQRYDHGERDQAAAAARTMSQARWAWAPLIMEALGPGTQNGLAFDIWNRLPDWEDVAPIGNPSSEAVSEDEARARLRALLADSVNRAPTERRDAQSDYAALVSTAFAPKDTAGQPHIVLAEAGTGIGKTLGYIAPASVWAEKNGPGVWISTYTKNLQRQIDQELDRLYPDPYDKRRKAVVRKGRENYLCLLNFQESLAATGPILAGLVARWALESKDGDMVGGDFPSWLPTLSPRIAFLDLGPQSITAISGFTDRRGECLYSACTHYRKCFVEKVTRRARRADIVVANHALVMMHAAQRVIEQIDGEEPSTGEARPTRFIFDEGHHVFDAADGAFSATIGGFELAELRRWILGPEGRRRRGRSLEDRMADLLDDGDNGRHALSEAKEAANGLPGPGWLARVMGSTPAGPAEHFLMHVFRQVVLRNEPQGERIFDLETEPWPHLDGLSEAADELAAGLTALQLPLMRLAHALRQTLDKDAAKLETPSRSRIESVATSLTRRARMLLPVWQAMLKGLHDGPEDGFVDWFAVHHAFGRTADVGMHRHWVDPTIPFAKAVLEPAHGVIVTSATLRDRTSDEDGAPLHDWQSAEIRTGASHLPLPATRASFKSPFNYAEQTKVFVVTDVKRTDFTSVAAAYRELFLASGGGALGLFTAIDRLRRVYDAIAEPLEERGLELYAQHVDAMDVGTLVDIFRAETNSCLLGTDAVRDGVDVPGRSLRLIVFDRVPWPRPDILHKARRERFGGRHYDDLIVRLRLKQAFGRLVRRSDDRGIFVMLDGALPSRLATAFPEEVQLLRLGLKDVIDETRRFLDASPLAAEFGIA